MTQFGCCQNRFGIPFRLVGEFTTHFRTYFSGDWDARWGHGTPTHEFPCALFRVAKMVFPLAFHFRKPGQTGSTDVSKAGLKSGGWHDLLKPLGKASKGVKNPLQVLHKLLVQRNKGDMYHDSPAFGFSQRTNAFRRGKHVGGKGVTNGYHGGNTNNE